MQFLLFALIIFIYFVNDQTNAFSIELIHRNAPQSPFHKSNLEPSKTSQQVSNSTNSTGITENKTLIDLNGIRPVMDVEHTFSPYLVKVSLGTFNGGRSSSSSSSSSTSTSSKSYFLELDTASDLIWMQCEDSMHDPNFGFRQIDPLYPNSKSSSYKPLPCNQHPLCYPNQCIDTSCSYHVTYADDSFSWGVLAKEKFTFPSTDHGREETFKLVYGCGLRNHYAYSHDNVQLKLAGTFGLGWGARSFVNQINSISHGRFSYCLPPLTEAVRGMSVYLRFGWDIPSYSNLASTTLRQYHDNNYYVNLVDISVNGERLNIPSWYLDKRDSTSGCILDTGTSPTLISPAAYDILKMAVIIHIGGHVEGLKMVDPISKYNLCYQKSKRNREIMNLPTITFHFENNADLVVEPEIGFTYKFNNKIQDKYVCLSMIANDEKDGRTILGSDIQANQFMVYDLSEHTVYFGQRDCVRNH